MLHPSYLELMEVANQGVEEGEQPVVESRYSIVKAAAERAKQIIDSRSIEEKILKGPEGMEDSLTHEEEYKLRLGTPFVARSNGVKPLSVAVEELYEGKVKIVSNEEEISEDE